MKPVQLVQQVKVQPDQLVLQVTLVLQATLDQLARQGQPEPPDQQVLLELDQQVPQAQLALLVLVQPAQLELLDQQAQLDLAKQEQLVQLVAQDQPEPLVLAQLALLVQLA